MNFFADKAAINRQPRTQIHKPLKSNHHFAGFISNDGIEKLSSFPFYGSVQFLSMIPCSRWF